MDFVGLSLLRLLPLPLTTGLTPASGFSTGLLAQLLHSVWTFLERGTEPVSPALIGQALILGHQEVPRSSAPSFLLFFFFLNFLACG